MKWKKILKLKQNFNWFLNKRCFKKTGYNEGWLILAIADIHQHFTFHVVVTHSAELTISAWQTKRDYIILRRAFHKIVFFFLIIFLCFWKKILFIFLNLAWDFTPGSRNYSNALLLVSLKSKTKATIYRLWDAGFLIINGIHFGLLIASPHTSLMQAKKQTLFDVNDWSEHMQTYN